MLADLEGSLLLDLRGAELKALQMIMTTVSSIIWFTNGGLLTGKNPEHSLIF